MSLRPSERGRATIFTALLVVALCGCASTQSGPIGAGDILRIKKVVDPAGAGDSTATSTEFVQIFRQGPDSPEARVPLVAFQRMVLTEGDSLSLSSMWRARLRLTATPGEWDWVVLAPELMTARGEPTPREQVGGAVGQYSIRRREDRAVLDVHTGAVVLKDWGANTSETICVGAAGRCAVATDRASFAVRVDAEGAAHLYVTSGAVTVTSESSFLDCRAANVPPDVACDIPTPTTAAPGTLWRWSVNRVPTQDAVDPADEDLWRRVIQYNGEDLWRDRRVPGWAPWLLVPATIIACLATDFWICGDDSVSGTVIVVGS